MGLGVEFRVLGPLEGRHGEVLVDLGTPKQRTILALLLLHANQPVSMTRIIDELWPGGAPNSAAANVTTYFSRLRRTLAAVDCPLRRRDSAYCLQTALDAIDFNRFVGLTGFAETAWRAGDIPASAHHWQSALALWRGQAFEGVATGPELDAARAGWHEKRLAAFESHARARLRLGDCDDLVAALMAHTRAEPLRETGWLLLMAALRLTGNSASALEAYEHAKLALDQRLGTDPGRRLRDLHRAILADDDETIVSIVDCRAAVVVPPAPVPAQLPPDVSGFVGRGRELRRLDATLSRVPITVVAGMAGVGKTALAVHWAHRVVDRFPDGQIYLDLRGFDQGSELTPPEALRLLLQALGMAPPRIPADLDAQVGMYRSLLSGRRVLLVLDNAKDANHVRPLLPGSPGCAAVVTSRNALTGLVAVEGAQPLLLDLLSADEAADLLRLRLGAARVAGDGDAAKEIIARCAGLPLALAIVAARGSIRAELRLSTLAQELASGDGPLDALDGGDPSTDVRTVFSWSYRALSPSAAHLFRLLGRHPGQDFTLPAAASLLGVPPRQARVPLEELVRAHLLAQPRLGRYTFHDLLRGYAAELALTDEVEAARTAALHRLVDHYLHSALAASRLLETGREPVEARPPLPEVSLADLTGREDALAWFAGEHRVLMAVVRAAAKAGLTAQAWALALALAGFLDNQGHWPDWTESAELAVAAAQRLADPAREARAQRVLARGHAQLSRFTEAESHYLAALRLYAKVGDPSGQAATHFSLSWMMELRGNYDESLRHALRSLDLFESAGHPIGHARALNLVGWCHAMLGDYPRCLRYGTRALAAQDELGDLDGQAATWDTIGYAHHRLGHAGDAIPCYQSSLELYRRCGDRLNEADVLTHLGDAHEAVNDVGSARAAWQLAVDVLEELGHADAEGVRTRLKAVCGSASGNGDG